jgi:hypothetical protein
MPHIILGRRNGSENAEMLCIQNEKLMKAPRDLTVQSCSTFGDAVFNAPVQVIHDLIAGFSRDYSPDCRMRFRQLQEASQLDSQQSL